MTIGYDYFTFMELDPVSIKPFFNAYKTKCKEQITMINIDAWYHGLYVQRAIGSCFPSGEKYPNKPIDFNGCDSDNDLNKSNSDKANTDVIKFSAWTKMFNQGFTKRQEIAIEPQ